MLISTEIKIEVDNKNLRYHQRTNKDLVVGDIFIITLEQLSHNSGLKVEVECDYCQSYFITEYRKYLRSIKIINKSSCKNLNCVSLKTKESNQEKYGVDNVMQLEVNQLKAKQTNLEKFGVDHPMKLDETKDNIRKNNLEKFGFDHPMKLDETKNRLKRNNLEKWGVDNPMKLDEVKNRLRQTNLDKFGVDNYTKTEEYKEKSIRTNLINWGVDNYTKTDDYKEKTRKTNLKKFGFQYSSHNEEFRKKNFTIAQHPNYIRFLIDEKISEFNCDCGKEHTFKILSDNFYQRLNYSNPLCTECYPISNSRSIKEDELYKIIKSMYSGEIIQSYRDEMEIDIYLPLLKIGFEFNGLYWHSNIYRENVYHLNKTKFFNEREIRIIHIWEDDYTSRKDIILSQIRNIINKNKNKIFARNCKIKEIDSKEYKHFLNNNHIQGSVGSVVKIGLYYQDNLVTVMGFDQFEGRKKMVSGEWNLNRFCSVLDTTVVGGASKLLNYFINTYYPKRIVSYADRDWSIGELYQSLKFTKISESKPDYKYVVEGIRTHKSRFRKSVTKISESELNLPRVYDCGKIKYEKLFA